MPMPSLTRSNNLQEQGTTLASLIVAMSQANHKIDFAQATAQGSRNGFRSYLF